MIYRRVNWLVLAFCLSGCAIHPLPEDVTGVDTPTIVRQIRCETRETVRLAIIAWMKALARRGDPLAAELSRKYESDPESISTFHYDIFRGQQYEKVRAVAKLFYETGVAYNFDLTMTEDNDIGTNVDLLQQMTSSKLTLGIKAGANRKRSNNRTFTVTDNFKFLITQLNTEVRPNVRYCNEHVVGPNYAYPITGRIGVDKLARDFIELTLFGNLGGTGAKPGEAGGVPAMADKLSFTTTISASVSPVVVFTPLKKALHVTNVSLTPSVDRTDLHVVTVALAIAPSGFVELDATRTYLFSERDRKSGRNTARISTTSPGLVVGRRVIGGGTRSEVLAVLAIDQLKSRELQIVPSH